MTVALLFPGQGAYAPEPARSLSDAFPEIAEVYAEVDAGAGAAGAAPVSDVLLSAQPPTTAELVARAPETLQLAIYALSVGLHRLVAGAPAAPALSMGHSLGEIAALTAGGALTVSTGAQVVAHRARALRAVDGQGGMLALACSAQRAGDLLGLVADPGVSIAALNASGQTVVSGPQHALVVVKAVAGALKIGATELASPYAFHNPALQPVAEDFAARIAGLPVQAPQRPVYSPILRRFYDDADDVRTLLPQHLLLPVDFCGAVRQLRASGVATFLECGAGTTLISLAARAAAGIPTATVAPRGGERAAVAGARALLHAAAVPLPGPAHVPTRAATAPPPEDATAAPVVVPSPRPAPAAAPAASPAPSPAPSVRSRAVLFDELRAMYAEALEYPAEVFTEEVALEAELGIDSVKQTELFARTVEAYGLPQPDEAIALAEFDTMGKVVDLVWSMATQIGGQPPAAATAEDSGDEPVASVAGHRSRAVLFDELRAMYAETLEYPAEVFTEEVALEAELGIDSVKQTELFARTVETFGLPQPDEAIALAEFDTMGKVVDLVWSMLSSTSAPAVRSAA